jgi:hypothetical protein
VLGERLPAIALLLALIQLGSATPGAGQQGPRSTRANISPARLRQDLYRLADDSMMGREPGSPGNWKAAAYVADEFRRLGLHPAGDSGSYFQHVPLSVVHVNQRAILEVDGTPLEPGSDFLPSRLTTRPLHLDGAEAIYGGDARDSLH